MKSKKLRKLIASVAILAMSVTVVSGGVVAGASTSDFEQGWAVNAGSTVYIIDGQGTQLTANNPTKTEETIFSIERVLGEVLTNETQVVGGNRYKANENEGGVLKLGVRFSGKLDTLLRSYVNSAVSEFRNNVNTVNANKHNNGTRIENQAQLLLGEMLQDALWGEDSTGRILNQNVKFIVTYELSDGRIRTTSVDLSDITLDKPLGDEDSHIVNSVSDLKSIVDENGLVYLTLRGLPSNVNVTNIELDSRSDLHAVTSNNAYSVQKSVRYNAGRVYIPTSTWILTGSLYPEVTTPDGRVLTQFEDIDNNNVIGRGEHVFVDVAGTTVTLIDILRDVDKSVKGVTVTDRRGNTYNAEVGDFAHGKHRDGSNDRYHDVNYGNRYRDVKITGLNNRTSYEFEYMDITYRSGDVEKTQRVRFDNLIATGGVTGNRYLNVITSDYLTSQIYTFELLDYGNLLYQVNVGKNSLEYLVKVDDVTNLSRIEVRGLRNGETYTVENVKSEDGKKDKSNWYAVKITGLDENRNYDFLSLEVVYSENGRDRYGTPISLGRRSTIYNDVLFPGNDLIDGYNQFTTTNRGNVSELWIDSSLKYEEIPGGVRFYGRIKDADDLLNKVNVYVNNGGSYEKVDDSNVKVEKSYRVVKGLDVNNDGNVGGDVTIDYPHIIGHSWLVSESSVESASEMVEITVKGIPSGVSKDFKFEFSTNQDGNRVSSILTGNVGAFGSIPTNATKTQQSITRYASGRAGITKVQVNTSNVQVSGVTTTTANIVSGITNPDKESINIEVTGVSGITAKYDVEKNIIELSGLKAGTEYKDLKLTLKYGDRSSTITVPTFKTTSLTPGTPGNSVLGYVSRVYRTFFDREPDQGGLTYWTDRLVGKIDTLSGFLGQLSFTPELLEKNLTNVQFVEKMYAIVDRAGEPQGISFWVSEIEKGLREGKNQSQARADVVNRMLDTDEVKGIAIKLGINFK